jgi:signal transduction histidine kinase
MLAPPNMPESLLPQSRAERLIAAGRSVLAVASFGAIYLDPLEPARLPALTWALLGGYTAYALGFLLWTIASTRSSARVRLGTHVLDILFFGTINYLTAGASSPFFVYFVFSIVCAMLRFGRRGTVATAIAAILVFMASALARTDATLELNRFIIRSAYLLVVASLLVYLADYQQRIQADLARIARWRRSPTHTYDRLLEELLREPALLFAAQRVLLAYEHLASRTGILAHVDEEHVRCERVPPELVDALLDSDSITFVRSGSYAAVASERAAAPGMRPAPSIPAEVTAAYAIRDVVATSFTGELVRGRLLLLDGRPPLLEEVSLARIAGAVIASRLDHYHAAEQLRRGAVAEERVRVARDLHDSVLQSLTGAALQLRTLPKLMIRDHQAAEQRLGEIEQVIVAGQKELRWFIEQLHPDRSAEERETASIVERLESMSQQWELAVESDVAPLIRLLPAPLRYDVYTLVSEAVANAAKHAAASCVRVAAQMDARDVRIDVADDGKGFPFRGRYTLPELARMNCGPLTLRERVASLGGSMIVDSTDRGSRIEIRLPLHGGEA